MLAIENLLREYEETKIKYEDNLINERIPLMEKVLSEFATMRAAYTEWNLFNAVNYNIFDILNIQFRETKTHTPFLVNLLKPSSTHGQRLLFYNKFLDQINLPLNKVEYFRCSSIYDFEVIEEKSTVFGRIDILIQGIGHKERFAIVIENKINASDQEQQLSRYYDYCIKTLGLTDDKILLVYLTKDGKSPSYTSLIFTKQEELKCAGVLVQMSYNKNIRNMLEDSMCYIQSENVKVLVKQYLNIIKSF